MTETGKRRAAALEALPGVYHKDIPLMLSMFLSVPEMKRLSDVGMNCGCEYTSFKRFRDLPKYSRLRHSVGAALIVWHFSERKEQALAALFHDIAAPAFAHSIDFLRGDYLVQESTEDRTEKILVSSPGITALLKELGVSVDMVKDYHVYPIADNETPRLSADRLEYTLGNFIAFGFADLGTVRQLYDDLYVVKAPDGMPELAFRHHSAALEFAQNALKCSRVYTAPEDRYSMQRLSEIIGHAIRNGVMTEEDLYLTEGEVINKLEADNETREEWLAFRSMSRMVHDGNVPPERRRVVPAKKRCIDPLVNGVRLSEADAGFGKELDEFLSGDQSAWLYAE